MSGELVNKVLVDAEYPEPHGLVQFEDVEILVVDFDDGGQHVWFAGTHYVAERSAETVSEGDMFYQTLPETKIYKVAEIDESETHSVEIEYLYPSGGTTTDRVSRETLTGVPIGKRSMGYTGPPKLLEEHPLEDRE